MILFISASFGVLCGALAAWTVNRIVNNAIDSLVRRSPLLMRATHRLLVTNRLGTILRGLRPKAAEWKVTNIQELSLVPVSARIAALKQDTKMLEHK